MQVGGHLTQRTWPKVGDSRTNSDDSGATSKGNPMTRLLKRLSNVMEEVDVAEALVVMTIMALANPVTYVLILITFLLGSCST